MQGLDADAEAGALMLWPWRRSMAEAGLEFGHPTVHERRERSTLYENVAICCIDVERLIIVHVIELHAWYLQFSEPAASHHPRQAPPLPLGHREASIVLSRSLLGNRPLARACLLEDGGQRRQG